MSQYHYEYYICAGNARDVADEVIKKQKDGWTLHGHLCFQMNSNNDMYFAQAVTKYIPDTP